MQDLNTFRDWQAENILKTVKAGLYSDLPSDEVLLGHIKEEVEKCMTAPWRDSQHSANTEEYIIDTLEKIGVL